MKVPETATTRHSTNWPTGFPDSESTLAVATVSLFSYLSTSAFKTLSLRPLMLTSSCVKIEHCRTPRHHRSPPPSTQPSRAPTLTGVEVGAATVNTPAESGRLFKVLSVEVVNLRCASKEVAVWVRRHCGIDLSNRPTKASKDGGT